MTKTLQLLSPNRKLRSPLLPDTGVFTLGEITWSLTSYGSLTTAHIHTWSACTEVVGTDEGEPWLGVRGLGGYRILSTPTMAFWLRSSVEFYRIYRIYLL